MDYLLENHECIYLLTIATSHLLIFKRELRQISAVHKLDKKLNQNRNAMPELLILYTYFPFFIPRKPIPPSKAF